MTDNKIKKALDEAELFLQNRVKDGQPIKLSEYDTEKLRNISQTCAKAYDKITRQQAENENLKVENQSLRTAGNSLKMHYEEAQTEVERLNALVKTKNKLIEGLDQSISYAYDRAIKDFAERLKNGIINDTAYACDSTQHSGYYDYQIKIGDIPEYIDNLVKEMVGDDNA